MDRREDFLKISIITLVGGACERGGTRSRPTLRLRIERYNFCVGSATLGGPTKGWKWRVAAGIASTRRGVHGNTSEAESRREASARGRLTAENIGDVRADVRRWRSERHVTTNTTADCDAAADLLGLDGLTSPSSTGALFLCGKLRVVNPSTSSVVCRCEAWGGVGGRRAATDDRRRRY